jgi:hypothetical protein
MLFVSALLTIFSCFKNAALLGSSIPDKDYIDKMQLHLAQFVLTCPLNIIAWCLTQIGLVGQCGHLFDHYDAFLTQLDDEPRRKHLDGLRPEQVYTDESFLEIRAVSHGFQDVLTDIFFGIETEFREFVVEYGVF